MNIIQLISNLQKTQNPFGIMQQIFNKNPQFQRVMEMIQGKNPQEIEQLVRNTAQTQGIDLNQFAQQNLGINLNNIPQNNLPYKN